MNRIRDQDHISGNADYGPGLIVYSFTGVAMPAVAWLFGSGLIGLVGMARQKKKA